MNDDTHARVKQPLHLLKPAIISKAGHTAAVATAQKLENGASFVTSSVPLVVEPFGA